MQIFLNTLSTSSWAWGILAIFTILSVFISVYLYLLSKKEKCLVYDYSQVRYISNLNKGETESKLELYYDGKKIDNYYVHILCIFNQGKEPIKLEDIAKKNPLIIKAGDKLILEAKILYSNSEINDVKIERSGTGYEVKFEFLRHNDGVITQIISEYPIEFSGSIIDQKIIKRVSLNGIVDNSNIILFSTLVSILLLGNYLVPILDFNTKNLNFLIRTGILAIYFISFFMLGIAIYRQVFDFYVIKRPTIVLEYLKNIGKRYKIR